MVLFVIFDNPSLTCDSFECGFFPILIQMLKYKFYYWMISVHWLVFELEIVLLLVLIFKFRSKGGNCLPAFSFGVLFIDLLLLHQLFLF
jgi:NADH:ubiquinone oxidoreductase subunit 3 (subunit A)